MAKIKLYDNAGITEPLNLIGDSGYLSLSELAVDTYTYQYEDDGSTIRERIYLESTLVGVTEYDYESVSTPLIDSKFTEISSYDANHTLVERWYDLAFLQSDILEKNAFPLLVGDDWVEGNKYANYLLGALGDDALIGHAGDDTLDGGRSDDLLYGGIGNDILYGGLGTDTAIFAGHVSHYSYLENSDQSVTIVDNGSGANDGTDTLYDVEWLVFDYGLATESWHLTSELLYDATSLISGWDYYDPTDTSFLSGDEFIIDDGTFWTFEKDEHLISWALADNGSYDWPDLADIQGIIGNALEEFTKIADLTFQYFGSFGSVSAAEASGADFIYTVDSFDDAGTIAEAFFPYFDTHFPERTIDYSESIVDAVYPQSEVEEFLTFVTLHETGHTLGLKHPHDPSYLNPSVVGTREQLYEDGYSTLYTTMSYYNETGAASHGERGTVAWMLIVMPQNRTQARS